MLRPFLTVFGDFSVKISPGYGSKFGFAGHIHVPTQTMRKLPPPSHKEMEQEDCAK